MSFATLQDSIQTKKWNRSRAPRQVACVSSVLDYRLAAYALVAGATGVSIAALSQPASGQSIVYTAADISFCGGIRCTATPINIDFNHDGVTDITIFVGGSGYSLGTADISYYRGAATWGAPAGNGAIGQPLTKGMEIGPNRKFKPGGSLLESILSNRHHTFGKSKCFGPFKAPYNQPATRFLGVQFSINGETHYGWVRLRTECGDGSGFVTGTVTGYAFNTSANEQIRAGQLHIEKASSPAEAAPGTLGMLAAGSMGLQLWRR